jgi:hypothetical protein
MYPPLIFKIKSNDLSKALEINTLNSTIITSSSINIPLMTLGFQYFLHRTKSSLGIIKNLETTNEFYYVINPFEYKIPNYEDSLDKLTNYYFNIKSEKLEIKHLDFYKLWEIIFLFNICDIEKLVYVTINENSGSFIQAIINYRQKINKGLTNDKIFNSYIYLQNNLQLSDEFVNSYNKVYPNLFNLYKNQIKNKNDINNDSIKSIIKILESSKNYANLIIANGNLNLEIDDNYEEQKSYQLILGEIILALKFQAKNGHFIIKIFETFTLPTIKLIYILSSFYDEVYIYKPYFSRISNSEKYLICKTFKYDQQKDNKILNQKIKLLEDCFENMNIDKFIYDIYSDLILPSDYLDKFKFINIRLANLQQIMINEIVKYIKENNYFGDKYHDFHEKQIEATKWWVSTFYPPSDNLYKKNKEDLYKLILVTLDKYNIEVDKFSSLLIK